MKLSFSTLGCPDWSFDTIIRRAKEYGFDAIGIRGIMGEMDLTKIPELGEERRDDTLRQLADAGLAISMMLTSVKLSSPDPDERRGNIEDGKANVDLTQAVGCSMIRVYGGRIADGVKRSDADRWVAEGMKELADYGGKHGVYIAIETHDDYTDTRIVREVIEKADNEFARVLWDVHHPYRTEGQSMRECWDNIGTYTVDTHFKDSYPTDEDESGFKYGLLGEGDVPILEAMQLLSDGGYDGYYTLEWEKKWKPYLPAPEVGFPQYVDKMKEYRNRLT